MLNLYKSGSSQKKQFSSCKNNTFNRQHGIVGFYDVTAHPTTHKTCTVIHIVATLQMVQNDQTFPCNLSDLEYRIQIFPWQDKYHGLSSNLLLFPDLSTFSRQAETLHVTRRPNNWGRNNKHYKDTKKLLYIYYKKICHATAV